MYLYAAVFVSVCFCVELAVETNVPLGQQRLNLNASLCFWVFFSVRKRPPFHLCGRLKKQNIIHILDGK